MRNRTAQHSPNPTHKPHTLHSYNFTTTHTQLYTTDRLGFAIKTLKRNFDIFVFNVERVRGMTENKHNFHDG